MVLGIGYACRRCQVDSAGRGTRCGDDMGWSGETLLLLLIQDSEYLSILNRNV